MTILFTPERSKEEIQEKKAKIIPYELNQYNPRATRNGVNAKPVFWYNQSWEISIWFYFQGWPGAKAVSNHLSMLWFVSIADK
jgi:hypothetical protein